MEISGGEQRSWGGNVSLFVLSIGYNLLMARGKGSAVGFCDGVFLHFIDTA